MYNDTSQENFLFFFIFSKKFSCDYWCINTLNYNMQYFDTETQIVIATLIAFTSFAIIVCIVCSFKENVINTEQPKDEEESKRLFKSGEGLY